MNREQQRMKLWCDVAVAVARAEASKDITSPSVWANKALEGFDEAFPKPEPVTVSDLQGLLGIANEPNDEVAELSDKINEAYLMEQFKKQKDFGSPKWYIEMQHKVQEWVFEKVKLEIACFTNEGNNTQNAETESKDVLKTAEEWFKECLPPDIAEKAIANTKAENPEDLHGEFTCLQHALENAFIWSNSPEGIGYWSEVNKKYCEE
jgi:hypothetical protein